MRFICLSRPLEGVGMEQLGPLMGDEVRAAWQLYKDGVIREIYFRQDLIGVAIMAEADSLDAAKAAVANFPLAKAGLIEFDVIPIGPFTFWDVLFAKESSK
ncbi:MAG: YciI family protein [Paracoccus sp. (in: a-proteobacteria)]